MWLKKFFILNFLIVSIAAVGPIKVRWELPEEDESDLKLVKPFADPIDGIEYRLPNNTIPIHYDIMLSTSIHASLFSFDGLVTIRIKALVNTSDITVQFRQTTIMSADLLDENGDLIQANVQFSQDLPREFLIIRPINTLIENLTYHVRITYAGTLRNDDAGFYRGSYIDNNGVTKWHATTQFESTDARHAFPWYAFNIYNFNQLIYFKFPKLR